MHAIGRWLSLAVALLLAITSIAAGDSQGSAAAAAVVSAAGSVRLIDEPECRDIRSLCPTETSADLSTDEQRTLECVQTFLAAQIEALSDGCQHAIWRHTLAFLDDRNVQRITASNCTAPTKCRITDHPGQFLSCLLDHRDPNRSTGCTAQLQRIEYVAFSDFRLIGTFFTDCEPDIEQHQCGRLNADRQTVSQGETLACLQTHIDELQRHCREGVLRLSEYQADNVKLDRQLFVACGPDSRRFCPDLRPGTGAVYKCLLRNKADDRMSGKCAEQLLRRDKLIARDYRVSRGLARSCKDDIKNSHCRRGVSEDKDVRLAQILLCLEASAKNGTKLSGDCLAEMNDHRRLLMEDYQMSPEILSGCADDIGRFCVSVETGGKTIHCLMEHARPRRKTNGRLTAVCLRALETVVKVADVAEDWSVDPVLRDACKPVVDAACADARGARVMSCLMEKLDTQYMRPDCEQALMQIQYFVARNFKLDPQLYKHCKEDAVRFCHAKRSWDDGGDAADAMDPERGPMILPCLHRYAYHPEPSKRLQPKCLWEVKRVMRQRAISVDLIPEVEDECLPDLSALCFERTEKGEEMQCLQDNLEKLQANCKKAVTTYTIDEAANVELNPIIMTYCRSAMETHCAEVLHSNRDDGAMMECLIAHKNDAMQRPDQRCRAAIEHFQLISLKSYHFTSKFKEACRPHVMRFCPHSVTKNEVVACLSEVMRNDTLKAQRPTIPKECRQQVRAQLFQQRENVDFDPKLKAACQTEIRDLCGGVSHGAGQVLECLQTNNGNLGNECQHYLFSIKKSELADSSTDYTLITQCREMLRQYCRSDSEQHDALSCLKLHKDEPQFDRQCHLVVVNRMILQNLDYRYNHRLQQACSDNIAEFCTPIVAKSPRNEELNGKVVECLRVRFREGRLTERCQSELTIVLHEQALNYRLNPLLQAVCRDEIRVICRPNRAGKADTDDGSVAPEEHGEVEECLKMAFLENRLMSKQCKFEVATMIEESRADIHVDPLLQQACQVDLLRYCSNVQSGNGRQLKCLQTVLTGTSNALEPDCKLKLEKRMEMFQNSALIVNAPPEDLQALYRQVAASPSKHYFAVFMLACVFTFFAIGTLFGRVTTRHFAQKDK